jgi:hypothetical protein
MTLVLMPGEGTETPDDRMHIRLEGVWSLLVERWTAPPEPRAHRDTEIRRGRPPVDLAAWTKRGCAWSEDWNAFEAGPTEPRGELRIQDGDLVVREGVELHLLGEVRWPQEWRSVTIRAQSVTCTTPDGAVLDMGLLRALFEWDGSTVLA